MKLASLMHSAARPAQTAICSFLFAFACVLVWLAPGSAHALVDEWAGDDASFYQLPPDAPTGAHGTIVRWKRMPTLSPGLVFNSDGVAGFRIMYVSMAADQTVPTKTYVTGALLVPARTYDGYLSWPQIPRPIIGFGTGTQGLPDGCAGTHGLVNSSNYDIVLLRQALDKGWAIAMSDYQGQGTTPAFPVGHPRYKTDDATYIVGNALGRNVIDAVRASFELDAVATDAIKGIDFPLRIGINAVLKSTSKVAFWGYSEGGAAAAWAGQLQPTYDRNLNMRAVAAGGIPADILAVGNAINQRFSGQNPAFGVLIAAGVGFKAAYPELTFDSKLTTTPKFVGIDSGVTFVNKVKNECFIESVIKSYGLHLIEDYTVGNFNPLKDAAWQARFAENKLGFLPPTVPTFVYHATSDEGILFSQGRQMARDWCARGARVTWKTLGGEHVAGFLGGMGEALKFLDARFKNQTVANTACSDIN